LPDDPCGDAGEGERVASVAVHDALAVGSGAGADHRGASRVFSEIVPNEVSDGFDQGKHVACTGLQDAVLLAESRAGADKPDQNVLGRASEMVPAEVPNDTDAGKHDVGAALHDVVPVAGPGLGAERKALQEPEPPAVDGTACVSRSPEAEAAPVSKTMGDNDIAQDCPKAIDDAVDEVALPIVDSTAVDIEICANEQAADEKHLQVESKAHNAEKIKDKNCAKCDDTGKRGIFGRKGWGLVSRQCRHCFDQRAAVGGC